MSLSTGSHPILQDNTKPQSPRRTLRQEAWQISSSSVPSSPTWRTQKIKTGHGYPSQPQSATVGKSFQDDATVSDSMRDHDDGDPHDLSFPTKHFPRASLVDNLAMSLDKFSPSSNTSRGYARARGHTKSSSLTVDGEQKTPTSRETPIIEVHATKEGSKIQQVEKVSDLFVDEEETQREKTYNSQRATQPNKTMSHWGNNRRKSRSGSNSSSIDLGHLAAYAGRLGAAGNRRSQSFDFGSTRVKPAIDLGDVSLPQVVPGSDTVIVSGTTPHAGQDVTRRNSGRSVRGTQSKRGRSGTIGAGHGRSRIESPQPQLAAKSQTLDTVDPKPSTHNDQVPVPRAGFFRRVFGSSNKGAASTTSYPPVTRQSQDHTGSSVDLRASNVPSAKTQKQISGDSVHNKENQPVIAKKPSSFFRRRKKSTSSGVPPPLPLPLNLNNNSDITRAEAGRSSPVSSLRAFMDPYLADAVPKHARGKSLQGVQHLNESELASQSVDSNTKSTAVPVGNKGTSASQTVSPSKGTVRAPVPTSKSSSPTKAELENQRVIEVSSPTPSQSQTKQPSLDYLEQSRSRENSPGKTKPFSKQITQDGGSTIKMIKLVPQSSGSDTSVYKSAPSTPMVAEVPDRISSKSPAVHVSHPSMSQGPANEDIAKAQKIYDNSDDQLNSNNATAWLGEASTEREHIRTAYMGLFDWHCLTILVALRNLCSKLVLKGETQQVDRILDAFAKRWCDCNPNHGFKSTDIVHTICYSVLLLNTDLHLADIGRKMTRSEFIRNALETIRENISASSTGLTDSVNLLSVRTNSNNNPGAALRPSIDRSASSLSTARPTEHLSREESYDENHTNLSGPLVENPFSGSHGGWELQVESVLKDFYTSISREPLPLFGSYYNKSLPPNSMNNLTAMANLRRTPSTVSKATSENRGRYAAESRSLGARWTSKTRARPRLGTAQGFGSSRTSIDDQSSAWSPSMSSTWSKVSLNKTLTSMSVDSFGTEHIGGGFQSSIGFANALSQAIIRDEQMDNHVDDGIKAVPLLEDESLELYGAPWAKEGILKHKCHLDGVDKRSKDRNWNDCFAVIEKGWMRLFSFSMTAKSLRNKARNHKAGAVVGGGNWQDNAEEVWKFMLRHTIASSLPPPGYSKQRPYVWALSLPNGAVHLFSVGTPDIVKEFVSTANFWSARLSKEPMTGGVSSMEYGWSDSVINRSLVTSESHFGFNTSSPRPSTQLSMRSSMDYGNMRPRLPGDKVHISEWVPPQQSLMASQLLEIDQLKALQTYVKNVEEDLTKHNEFRSPMLLAFSTRHPNSQKAMTNWEKKSSYLLREIVKFRTYIDALQSAQSTKEKVDKMKKEEELSRGTETTAMEVTVGAN